MKLTYKIVLLLSLLVFSCKQASRIETVPRNQLLKSYILEQLELLQVSVDNLATTTDIERSREFFLKAHQSLKKVEPFLVYLDRKKMIGVNGPPLPVFREDNGKVLPAIGFQAIEEQLFSEDSLDIGLYLERVNLLQGYLHGIKGTIEPATLSARHLFIPIHQQLFSIFSLGIISFDTPTTQQGLKESIISLEGMEEVYHLTLQDTISALDNALNKRFLKHLNSAKKYLKVNDRIETFDRYTFTREFINPLTTDWRDIRVRSGLFEAPKNLAINMDAPTFFEEDSFNILSFLKTRNTPSESIIMLGKELFSDPALSSSGTISCATCHQPEKAYQDGLKIAVGKDGKQLRRNTPSIINSVFQRKFFWDGRSDDLVQQINLVFENEDEFARSSSHVFSLATLDSTKYAPLVTKSFPDTRKLTKKTVSRAIASYVATLNAFNSKFDKNMRGESSDFTEQEKLGMNIYMGKALCATCHFLPLTSGTVPPNLRETEKEVIGTPKTAANKEIDPDEGFYWIYEEDIHKYMFKTPSIRNAELTAPYMHNGVYDTLEEVMNFYNLGGGGGLGFDLEHQTLPFDNLQLSDLELDALVAFTKTLTDTNIQEQ
jgi:cytochrome c peroxidase